MRIYIALGANRGHEEQQFAAALKALERAGVHVLRLSRWRRTAPEGATGRRWFLNGVIAAETNLLPRVLLRRMQAIEHAAGRRRLLGGKKTPRPLDLDLLAYGGVQMAIPELTLPHAAIKDRKFVQAGLAEVRGAR